MKKLLGSCALVAIMMATAGVAVARDQIKVTGSSTVFPYSQAAAEEYANKTGNPAPVVEFVGTGGGFKAFCGGVGEDFADITGASRAIKESEVKLCADNGVTDITEALIGYDGLSVAVSRGNTTEWSLTEEQIFKALASELPTARVALSPTRTRCGAISTPPFQQPRSLPSAPRRHQAPATRSSNWSCMTAARACPAWRT